MPIWKTILGLWSWIQLARWHPLLSFRILAAMVPRWLSMPELSRPTSEAWPCLNHGHCRVIAIAMTCSAARASVSPCLDTTSLVHHWYETNINIINIIKVFDTKHQSNINQPHLYIKYALSNINQYHHISSIFLTNHDLMVNYGQLCQDATNKLAAVRSGCPGIRAEGVPCRTEIEVSIDGTPGLDQLLNHDWGGHL